MFWWKSLFLFNDFGPLVLFVFYAQGHATWAAPVQFLKIVHLHRPAVAVISIISLTKNERSWETKENSDILPGQSCRLGLALTAFHEQPGQCKVELQKGTGDILFMTLTYFASSVAESMVSVASEPHKRQNVFFSMFTVLADVRYVCVASSVCWRLRNQLNMSCQNTGQYVDDTGWM